MDEYKILDNKKLVHGVVCLCMATLTDGFPCFFLSCKANARVKPVKTKHGPHSS